MSAHMKTMESFNKENIIISQDDISTPLKKKVSHSLSNASPLKDKSRSFMNASGQFTNASHKDSFILPDEDPLLKEYQNLERQLANMMIQNNSMAQDIQTLEMDSLIKEKDLLAKSSKINELVIENRQLEKSLQQEIQNSEANFANWTTLKMQYEAKIANLNSRISFERTNLPGTNGKEQVMIQILNKKLKSLESDYELEKNSKMLIIDEFEIIKQNYLNLELNYNLLRNEYDKLHEENEMGTNEEVSKIQQQDLSFQSDSSYGDDDVEHIYSNSERSIEQPEEIQLQQQHQYQQRLTLAEELRGDDDKYKHNQELIKLNFQIKSLNLQNEKLYSYIGYLLQNSIDNSKEYSDEKLIRIAKRRLVNNKILRSVSSSAKLHQSNRSEHPQQLTVYADHATDEEMSIFLNDCYETVNKKIYNIKSTANLKKLRIINHLAKPSDTIQEEDLKTRSGSVLGHHDRIKLSILNDLIIGSRMSLQRLDLSRLLFNGVIRFLDLDTEDFDSDISDYDEIEEDEVD